MENDLSDYFKNLNTEEYLRMKKAEGLKELPRENSQLESVSRETVADLEETPVLFTDDFYRKTLYYPLHASIMASLKIGGNPYQLIESLASTIIENNVLIQKQFVEIQDLKSLLLKHGIIKESY